MLKTLDISSLQFDKEQFIKVKDELKQEIMSDFAVRRNNVVLILDNKQFQMTAGQALLNLMLMQFYVNCNIKLTEKDVFTDSYISEKNLNAYFTYILKRYAKENKAEFTSFRAEFVDLLNKLNRISVPCNMLAGNTISLNDFIELAATNEEARHLFRPEIPNGMQFNEIENLFNEYSKKLMTFYKTTTESELHPYCVSGTGINVKQFTQFASFIGLKPDMKGGIIPYIIKDNFLYGFSNLRNYYINAVGTRKAQFTNYTYVRKSGYLTRKLLLSLCDTVVDPNIEDCGTKHFYICNVTNKDRQSKIVGRHYYEIDDKGNIGTELNTVLPETDLVGKTIALRSPITCCAKDANGNPCVCATCYGKQLAEINRNKHAGIIATLKLTDPLTQKLLSAKHLLSTNSQVIDFGEDFKDAFTINLNTIQFNENSDYTIEFKVESNNDFDEDLELYFINKLNITNNITHKTIVYNSPTPLFINPKIPLVIEDDENITLNSKTWTDWVFQFVVKNNELTKSLENILNLIESSSHLGINEYSEFANTFCDLLIENGLDVMSVHAELIASILIRNEATGERLDFSKENIDPYKIIRVSKAVMSGSISKALSFERIREQLANLDTYKKNETSYIDYLFK